MLVEKVKGLAFFIRAHPSEQKVCEREGRGIRQATPRYPPHHPGNHEVSQTQH